MAAGIELGAPDRHHQNGTEPLDVTAKNGAPGGSFCVRWATGRAKRKTHDSGLMAACGGMSGRQGCDHFAHVNKMVAGAAASGAPDGWQRGNVGRSWATW